MTEKHSQTSKIEFLLAIKCHLYKFSHIPESTLYRVLTGIQMKF